MIALARKKCIPCEGGMPPLASDTARVLLRKLDAAWKIIDGKKIRREFRFRNFADAMNFVNRVAGIAEAQGHHPDVCIRYNRVDLELWTHAIGGLSENDFIVAAKIDEVVEV